jgi:hypothetical protein
VVCLSTSHTMASNLILQYDTFRHVKMIEKKFYLFFEIDRKSIKLFLIFRSSVKTDASTSENLMLQTGCEGPVGIHAQPYRNFQSNLKFICQSWECWFSCGGDGSSESRTDCYSETLKFIYFVFSITVVDIGLFQNITTRVIYSDRTCVHYLHISQPFFKFPHTKFQCNHKLRRIAMQKGGSNDFYPASFLLVIPARSDTMFMCLFHRL